MTDQAAEQSDPPASPSPSASPRVIIANISRGHLSASMVAGVIQSLQADVAHGFVMAESGPYLDAGRNRAVANCLTHAAGTWEWLLFVDSDIEFTPKHITMLLAPYASGALDPITCPLIGGIYANPFNDSVPGEEEGADRIGPVAYEWLEVDDLQGELAGVPTFTFRRLSRKALAALPPYCEGDDVCQVACVGTGFMAIHRSLLTHMEATYPQPLPWFDEPVRDGVHYGEDMGFPVDPATPVLDGDHRWRPLSSFSIGEEVLAFDEFSPPHSSRRYRRAVVSAVIEKKLPRLRIVTNQREIITTAEHPWLMKKRPDPKIKTAWKWLPAGSLAVGNQLAAVVPQAENPVMGNDYQAGYIQGLLCSDGTRGHKGVSTVRMKDAEPIERLSTMLASQGMASRRGPTRWDGDPNHAPLHRLSVYERASREKLAPFWDETVDMPSREFAAGYLAGMYDGDGSHDGGALHIWNIKDARKDRVEKAARLLGVPFTGRDARSVWLHGQEDIFRFWQMTLPSLSRRTFPRGQPANDGSGRKGLEVLHREEAILAVEPMAPGDVACLTTTTATFIADGLGSHNCLRLMDMGYPVLVHRGVMPLHHKTIKLI